jgi:putative aminopeptidase FrvX
MSACIQSPTLIPSFCVSSADGAVDVPLSWPLRYSHSPAEVIDTRDYDALAKIVAVLAKQW